MFWIFIAIVWVIAMGVGLWLVFHSYPDPDRIDVKRYAYRPQGLLTIGVSSGVFVLATVFFSFAQVNTGHVGVVRTFGRISGQINPGISLIAPWQTYDSVNVQVQKQTFDEPHGVLGRDAERQHHDDHQLLGRARGRPRPDRARRHGLVRPPRAEQPQPGVQGRGRQVHGRQHRARTASRSARPCSRRCARGSRRTRSASTT